MLPTSQMIPPRIPFAFISSSSRVTCFRSTFPFNHAQKAEGRAWSGGFRNSSSDKAADAAPGQVNARQKTSVAAQKHSEVLSKILFINAVSDARFFISCYCFFWSNSAMAQPRRRPTST